MSITTEIKVGALFASTNDLRTAIAKSLMESGRGVMSGSGGGKQKKFYCSGRQKTGATLPGCPYEVRATKLRTGDWNISFASLSHDNCSGGSSKGRMCGIQSMVSSAVRLDPSVAATTLKKRIETSEGIKLSYRTTARAISNAARATTGECAESYTYLPAFVNDLQDGSPGSIAVVEVSLY